MDKKGFLHGIKDEEIKDVKIIIRNEHTQLQ